MRKWISVTIILLTLPCGAFAEATPGTNTLRAADLSAADAALLGVIEGVTEFLPISSTGHLIIATRILKLDSEQTLVGDDGQPLWYKKPSAEKAGVPLTPKLAADTFTVVIQFGAIAAVALLYWRQIQSMLRGLLGRDSAGLQLVIKLGVAFAPAAVLGLLAADWIDRHLFNVGSVIAAQLAGAGLMLYAEHWRRRHEATGGQRRDTADLTLRSAFGIGLLQCVAMWPGTSRSMMTIVGGYFAGLEPRRAAEFSFLLGLVTLSAAAVYKTFKSGTAMIDVFGWPSILLGCLVAAVSAALAVRFLVGFLTRHGLAAFAIYRVVLAGALAVWFYI